ncbi:hypothetical protein DFP72DRAFT_787081, partial [Ephemerocybe angulata]
KRAYASNAKPIYDYVQGAGRGARPFKLARNRPLGTPIEEQVHANKMYTQWAHDMLGRCESIAVRSGCWMYLAIQHPSSKNPFYHYTSPKLLKEAPEAVREFHQEVSQTMTAVMRADRKGRVEKALATLKAEAGAIEAEKQKTEAAEQKLQTANAELEALRAQLATLTSNNTG